MPGGQDAHAAVLTAIGPKADASEGDPVESALVLFADGATEFGIWEVTPGTFRSSKNGVTELMHFVSGQGTITADDGTVTEVGPGVVLLTPDGWSGTWVVRTPVRKTYAINSHASPR